MAKIKSGVEFDKTQNHAKLSTRLVTSQQYTLRIPENLYKAVKIKMAKENKKLQPILIEMLEQYVKI